MNLFAIWGASEVVLSTHLDTVPPFFPSREDAGAIYGRGACDAKGILAAQVGAALKMKDAGVRDFGLLFTAGEEQDSAGAKAANDLPNTCRFLINGEPTENKLATATKGALRCELVAEGRAAHSAYPEWGDSAIARLLAALRTLESLPLPRDEALGETTYNVGVIEGGRAPNVIPDRARAEVYFRTVQPASALRARLQLALDPSCRVSFAPEVPPVRLVVLEGYETVVARFTSDVPHLARWGKPLLIGPGSMREAHAENENVSKKQLVEAVGIYARLVAQLKQILVQEAEATA
jgi:acetylornithine deacetylase